jgi:hypothetical protein
MNTPMLSCFMQVMLGLQAELISVRIYEDGTITDRKVGH